MNISATFKNNVTALLLWGSVGGFCVMMAYVLVGGVIGNVQEQHRMTALLSSPDLGVYAIAIQSEYQTPLKPLLCPSAQEKLLRKKAQELQHIWSRLAMLPSAPDVAITVNENTVTFAETEQVTIAGRVLTGIKSQVNVPKSTLATLHPEQIGLSIPAMDAASLVQR